MKRWITGLEVREKYDLLPGKLADHVFNHGLCCRHPVCAHNYVLAAYCDNPTYETKTIDGQQAQVLTKVTVKKDNDFPLWPDEELSVLDNAKFDIGEVEMFYAIMFNEPTPQAIVADMKERLEEAKKREEQLIAEIQSLQNQGAATTEAIDPKEAGKVRAKIDKFPF